MRFCVLCLLAACWTSPPEPQAPAPSEPPPVAPAPHPQPRPKTRSEQALATIIAFTDRMCACTDRTCADAVIADYTRWGQEMARNASGQKPDKIDEDLTKQMADSLSRFGDCMTKAMTPPTP